MAKRDPEQTGMGVLVLVGYALALGLIVTATSIETFGGAVFFALLCAAGLITAILMPWTARR